jgi:hypothetical protein
MWGESFGKTTNYGPCREGTRLRFGLGCFGGRQARSVPEAFRLREEEGLGFAVRVHACASDLGGLVDEEPGVSPRLFGCGKSWN